MTTLDENKINDIKNSCEPMFLVEDSYDINLNGNPESTVIGIFSSFENAKEAINKAGYTTLKWINDRRCTHTDDSYRRCHVITIEACPVDIFIGGIYD